MTLRASRRGFVPPFIAMDVLRAANERQTAGAEVIHLEPETIQRVRAQVNPNYFFFTVQKFRQAPFVTFRH